MGHETDRERIINLEHEVSEVSKSVDKIVAKLPEYDKLIDLNKNYQERLKKARGSIKKLKILLKNK